MPIAGLLALIWFLVRVVPKPSRATYPCQRVAGPLAGGFVAWIVGLIASAFAYRKAKELFRRSQLKLACACLAVAAVTGIIALVNMPQGPVLAGPPNPNSPIGQAKGVNPGRVVWVHDPGATDWQGPGHGHWWEPSHTSQASVDTMMSRAICRLAAEGTDPEAWDALIRHYNQTHGKGDVGYTPGEKVAIKVNFVGCIDSGGWGGVDPNTYDLVSKMDYMNTSPQMILALLRQLVYQAGVDPADISIGDPVCLFPNQYYNPLHNEFPEVHYLDHRGLFGRTAVQPSTVPFYWSCRPTGKTQDYILTAYAEADYFINLANLKSHSAAGVTLCGKNYYGYLRLPTEAGYYSMHDSLCSSVPNDGRYRCMVDLMGHAHSGGKALLYLIDGLYSGVHPDDDHPIRWSFSPFNNDWTSSLFASQDPVAIDSVGFDFLWEEGDPRLYPHMAGTDDYLHEAALADNPPSTTFYDPDHASPVTRLASLGVHEHWNNSTGKRYSRNLGTGNGIELVHIGNPVAAMDADPTSGRKPLSVDFDASNSYDPVGVIVSYEWDFDNDGTIDDAGVTVSHQYTQANDYTAKLTVTDDDGYTDTVSVQITVAPYAGDLDGDDDVDQEDFGYFQACLTGLGGGVPEGCLDADLDYDHDVDGQDLDTFKGCISGANVPADPDCGPQP